MGNDRLKKRLLKIEQDANLLLNPVAVVFQWPGETQEDAWVRHLELRPRDEFSPIRAFINVPGRREKSDARLYGYPIAFAYSEEERFNFEYHEIREGLLDLLKRSRELARQGDPVAGEFLARTVGR
jgi:hypothetical protein